MNKITTLGIIISALAVLPMCQQYTEDVIPMGQVHANNPAATALLNEAQAFIKAGKYDKAISKLKEICERYRLAPNAAEARFLLGDCYVKINDTRSAFKQYEKVITDYQHSNFYSQALQRQLTMAYDASNGKLQSEMFWGLWHVDMDSSVVKQWLHSIIKNAPYHDMAATSTSILGNYLVQREEYERAIVVLVQLVEKYPESSYAPAAQLMIAKLWATAHDDGNQNLANLNRAEEAYEEFTLLFPDHDQSSLARNKAKEMRSLMVDQQLQVARYYLNRALEYQAAIFTLDDVIRQKAINPEAAREAEQLLPIAKQKLAIAKEAKS